MNSVEQRVENQVQFWSLLGPFLLLVTIAVLLFKLSAHWYFPFAALIGIPLCVKGKLKGMAAALSCLFAIALFSYQELDLDERYWHVGMTLAMAFSFIILTLSLEEVEGLVGKMQRESQSRLDNFLRLDETTKNAEAVWIEERSHLNAKLASIAHDLTQTQEEKQVFYKLAQLAKDELVQMRTQQELLQKEIFYKKMQISQLDEKLDETEMTLQGFINSDSEQKIQNLTESLELSNQRQGTLQAQINVMQKQLQELEREKLANDANYLQELEVRGAEWQNQFVQEKSQLQEVIEKLQDRLAMLEQEKEQLQETFTVLRQQYEKVLHSEMHGKQRLENQLLVSSELELKLNHYAEELTSLFRKSEQLEQLKCECETDFKQKLAELRDEMGSLSEENEQLEQSKLQCEQELEWRSAELAELKNQMTILEQKREELLQIDSNTRGVECLYIQLRKQFQEKSEVLDQTRKELFAAQEALLCLEKEQEEKEIFSQTESEAVLLHEYSKLLTDYESMQQEIECLESLVGCLINLRNTRMSASG
ncbi:MAG: hypothetical protein ACHQUC_06965 [Chlamydiales bacterium]